MLKKTRNLQSVLIEFFIGGTIIENKNALVKTMMNVEYCPFARACKNEYRYDQNAEVLY